MVISKIQNSAAAAVELRILNLGIILKMIAKAARVKKIPFTCEITDLPGKKMFSRKYF